MRDTTLTVPAAAELPAAAPRLPLLKWPALALLLAALPVAFPGGAILSTLSYLGILAIFALSYNVLLGQTGLLSLGHATFFGLGGFVAVHVFLWCVESGYPLPLPLLPLVGGLGALLPGLAAGWLAARRGGMPFAMITLGLAELVHAVSALFPSAFGSEEGIAIDRMDGMPVFGLRFGSQLEVYGLVAACFFLSALVLSLLTRTPFGMLCNAVRDNAERVEFLGFRPERVRMGAYAIAAMFAGVAGALAAVNFEIMTVNELGAAQSALVLLMAYIGGKDAFFGPVLGAVAIGLMKVWLSDVTPAWQLYFGLLFVFMVMAAPGGLAGIVTTGIRLARSPQAARLAPRYAAVGAAGAVAAVGLSMLLELAYRAGLDAGRGPVLGYLGLSLDVRAVWSWALAAALLAGGALACRNLRDGLAAARHETGAATGGADERA